MPEQMTNEILSTPQGKHTRPLAVSAGPGRPQEFVIFNIDSKQPARQRPFADVSSEIRERLMMEAGQRLNGPLDKQIDAYHHDAKIVIGIDRYKKLAAVQPAQPNANQ
jgi:hypothetical protein